VLTVERLVAEAAARGAWSDRARELAWSAITDTVAVGLAGLHEEQTRPAPSMRWASRPRRPPGSG
ncbi:MAG TPA: hypothetical protein VEK80_04105, partial [Kribbellaceae bacterium]|nr:hypothetical protein [Kribbellaceae bacterium]